MVLVTVLRRFADFAEKCDRNVGDQFEATEKRAAYIEEKLPGYIKVTPIEKPDQEPTEDIGKLTVAQLKALASERGVEIPKGAKKAQLIALLEE